MAVAISGVRLQPWVGAEYTLGIAGKQVLIVGEAHHGSATQNDEPQFTSRCVEQVLTGAWKLKFFRNIQSMFVQDEWGLPGPTNEIGRRAFWRRVAFYNFVQEMIAGPRIAPTSDAWSRGHQPLERVLADLKPHRVLFVCKRLFDVASPRFRTAPALVVGHERRRAIELQYGACRGLGSYVLHPTYRGYAKQRAWVEALMVGR